MTKLIKWVHYGAIAINQTDNIYIHDIHYTLHAEKIVVKIVSSSGHEPLGNKLGNNSGLTCGGVF